MVLVVREVRASRQGKESTISIFLRLEHSSGSQWSEGWVLRACVRAYSYSIVSWGLCKSHELERQGRHIMYFYA